MNFNNPQVRARVIAHVNFAVDAAVAAFSALPESTNTDEKMIRVLTDQLKTPIIMQLLNFTLNLDYQLKNSITGIGGNLGEN